MGHSVRQFEKEASLRLGKGVEMLHRSVWDAPSASSKGKLVLIYKQEKDMSRTVWDAPSATKKEISFKPETEVEYVAWNCMGSAVRQFEKEVSFRPATGEVLSN